MRDVNACMTRRNRLFLSVWIEIFVFVLVSDPSYLGTYSRFAATFSFITACEWGIGLDVRRIGQISWVATGLFNADLNACQAASKY